MNVESKPKPPQMETSLPESDGRFLHPIAISTTTASALPGLMALCRSYSHTPVRNQDPELMDTPGMGHHGSEHDVCSGSRFMNNHPLESQWNEQDNAHVS